MDVRLTPEQRALRDSAARVVDRLGPRAVGQLDDRERAGRLDAAVDGSGWRELRVGAGGGPPPASGVEVALVAEELGRGLADAAFLGPTLAAELRRLASAPPAPAAETVAFAPGLGTVATAVAGGPVAVDTVGASSALVLVPAGNGFTLAQVALGPPDAAAEGTDLTRRVVAVPPDATVADVPGQARALTPDDLARLAALGLAVTCADLVGVMRGAVELASGYAKERRQYGVAVGSFQAVQHLLADALVATEGSRSVALHAAWAVDALPPSEASTAAALAKAWCARSARTVCETAIQVHGGIGNTWECLAHVFLRRALLSTDLLGGTGPSLGRVLEHHGIGAGDAVR